MFFSFFLLYGGMLPINVTVPILFPLLFQKNFGFFEIYPILLAKSMGTKSIFYI